MVGSSAGSPMILTSDDEKEEVAAAPVAAVVDEIPALLPDGFNMEGYYDSDDDGSFMTTGYSCPVTGMRFNVISEVLDYCFSGGLERAIAGKDTLQDKTTLQGKYAWLRGNHGWALEIRAGGDNNSKMFKFFVHLATGVRVASKNAMLHYIDEAELPASVNEGCDTSSEDNIIAQLEFTINSLPPGWVKETAFRKCSDGIRKDRYYTDPITRKVFRSLRAAEQYFESGGEPVGAHVPFMSVTEMYYFDDCTDMLPCLLRRLKPEGTGEQGQTSCRKKAKAGNAKRKATTGTPGASKKPKPSSRP